MNDERDPQGHEPGHEAAIPGPAAPPELDARTAALHAVFDDHADVGERSLVGDDPATLAELRRLTSLRDALVDVPVDALARDRAVSAALSVFDELFATPVADDEHLAAVAASTSAPTSGGEVVSLADRRRRRQRWALSAAAAVVVVAGGAIALQGGGTGSVADPAPFAVPATGDPAAKEAASAADAAGTAASDQRTAEDAGDMSATGAAPEAATEAAPAPGGAGPDADGAGTEMSDQATYSLPATGPGDDGSGGAPSQTIGNIPGAAVVVPEIPSPDALASYVSTAALVADGGACTNPRLLFAGSISYTGRPALAAREDVGDGANALALDPDTCEVVASAPLP